MAIIPTGTHVVDTSCGELYSRCGKEREGQMFDPGLPDRVDVGFDHLSWPSVHAARGGSLRLAPPSGNGTGTMRTGGARSQLPAGEHARHYSPDPLRYAGNAVFALWVMHSPAEEGWGGGVSHISNRFRSELNV